MASARTQKINLSPTIKIAAQAIMMKRRNIDIIDLSVGEPDFPTPDNIKEAAVKAIRQDHTKYTLNKGLIELRQAIVEKLKNDHALDYTIDQVIVSNGAKQSILNAVLSIVDPGDEVLVPVPYWASYPEIVKLAQGLVVFVPTQIEDAFKLTPQILKRFLTAKTKALILCNPSNPTGAVYTRQELTELSEIILNQDIHVISDEIYEKLVYDGTEYTSVASVHPELKAKTILVNGVSKSYAMTGWRIGYAAGPIEIIDAADIIQSHSTSGASSISQYASIEALSGSQDKIISMKKEFEVRRDYVVAQLNQITDIRCLRPAGAFYAFPEVSQVYGHKYGRKMIRNDLDFAYYLLENAGVAVVPGSAFGAKDHVRISYATSMDNLMEGMKRISAAINRLTNKRG